MQLKTTRTTFRVLWVVAIAFQVVNTVFLLTIARAYFIFDYADSILNYLANTFMFSASIAFLKQYHNAIGAAYTLCTLPFVYGLGRMVWYTVRRRQLAVGPARHRAYNVTAIVRGKVPTGFALQRRSFAMAHDARVWFKSTSIFGPHFTMIVLFIETLEVVLETAQGYQFSKYISNLQINQVYGLMIFINCWSTPITHYIWIMKKKNVMMGRLVCAIVDIVLDCAWGTILQGLLFYRYYLYYKGTPFDGIFINADRELRKILVVTNYNFVLSIFPFISSGYVMYEALEALSSAVLIDTTKQSDPSIVQASTDDVQDTSECSNPAGNSTEAHRNQHDKHDATGSPTPIPLNPSLPQASTDGKSDRVEASGDTTAAGQVDESSSGEVNKASLSTTALPVALSGVKRSSGATITRASTSTIKKTDPACEHGEPPFVKAYLVLMMVYGTMILVTSIAATDVFKQTGSSTGCDGRLYPWFTTDITCVSRHISCSDLQIVGRTTELTPILENMSRYLLSGIEFRDCPALEMPPILREFDSLVEISLTRVTVVEWELASAVTDPYFSQLLSLQVESVTFQTIPVGLVTNPLPSQLEFIGFDKVNANTFIHLVDQSWSKLVFWYCSNCGLTSFPTVVQHMDRLQQLLLNDNAIREIPAGALGTKRDLVWLRVPRNRLTSLPDDVWSMLDQLVWVNVQHSNISNVSASALTHSYPSLAFWADDSPLCTTTVAESARPEWLHCRHEIDVGWVE